MRRYQYIAAATFTSADISSFRSTGLNSENFQQRPHPPPAARPTFMAQCSHEYILVESSQYSLTSTSDSPTLLNKKSHMVPLETSTYLGLLNLYNNLPLPYLLPRSPYSIFYVSPWATGDLSLVSSSLRPRICSSCLMEPLPTHCHPSLQKTPPLSARHCPPPVLKPNLHPSTKKPHLLLCQYCLCCYITTAPPSYTLQLPPPS